MTVNQWHAADLSQWQGRTDIGEQGDIRRLFNVVEAFKLTGDAFLAGTPVVLGFACDAGVKRNQGRVGAADGPRAIRRMLAGLPVHEALQFQDAGDVVCVGDALEEAQDALAHAVHQILTCGGFPLVLGGGHEMAWGTWQGLRRHLDATRDQGRVLILNLDAHFDLRTARPGTSGTPFDQIAVASYEAGLAFKYACLGVSRLSNTAALFAHAARLGAVWVEDVDMQERHMEQVLETVRQLLHEVQHVYLSIDLDVLPAAVMPAVSAPAAYGVPLSVVEAIARTVHESGKLRVVDFAELNPHFDQDNHGARVASRLVYQLLEC